MSPSQLYGSFLPITKTGTVPLECAEVFNRRAPLTYWRTHTLSGCQEQAQVDFLQVYDLDHSQLSYIACIERIDDLLSCIIIFE